MSDQTAFSDVCGTMDELKRLLSEEHAKVSSTPGAAVRPLLSDALFMLHRMKTRVGENKAFRKKLQDALARMAKIEDVDIARARVAIAALRACTRSRKAFKDADMRRMDALAEEIRSIASAGEHSLRTYKDLALQIHDAFIEIKGKRPWLITEDMNLSLVETLRKEHQAWLPPEPHGGILLEWLSASRAHIPGRRGINGEPFVQFEDGGCILMSQARWNPDIRNFHAASFRPAHAGKTH